MIYLKKVGKTTEHTFLMLLLFLTIPAILEAQSVQEYYDDAVAAFEMGNYSEYLDKIEKANELRPNHRVIEYRLASAYVLNDQPKQAVKQLQHRINYYAIDDFSEDTLFQESLSETQINMLKKQIEEMTKSIQQTRDAFTFERKGFHPEGMIYSDFLDAFILSDARCGELISIHPETGEQTLIADLKILGYWGGFGMAQDPNNPTHIWIASSAIFNFCEISEENTNKAVVLKFDLENNEVLYTFEPEDNHVFGDLIVAENGDVYITDSVQPHIYKIDQESGEAKLWLEGESYWNLQGLALHHDKLIVSDYISGLYTIDLETKQYHAVSQSNQWLRGADGIYLDGDQLYLLQNGTRPMRVSSIQLDNEGFMIEGSYSLLESGIEALNEPTLGAIHKDEFYFIYNSPLASYNADGIPDLENWPELKIHKY
jgi:sugar lactone lactonase YvrE